MKTKNIIQRLAFAIILLSSVSCDKAEMPEVKSQNNSFEGIWELKERKVSPAVDGEPQVDINQIVRLEIDADSIIFKDSIGWLFFADDYIYVDSSQSGVFNYQYENHIYHDGGFRIGSNDTLFLTIHTSGPTLPLTTRKDEYIRVNN
jgi:hypothetical protein